MNNSKTVTAKQYAEKIGYTPSAVTKKLKKQRQPPYTLPFAVSVEKFGNTWLIELETPFPKAKAKNAFKHLEIQNE